jgi:hypothetical protein
LTIRRSPQPDETLEDHTHTHELLDVAIEMGLKPGNIIAWGHTTTT